MRGECPGKYYEHVEYVGDLHTKVTFEAFVDAVVPRTSRLAQKLGEIQYFGALDVQLDDYLIWSLDHYLDLKSGNESNDIPLSKATSEILDIAAEQLLVAYGNKETANFYCPPFSGPFAALAPADRLRAITLLEDLQVNLSSLPAPFRNNPGFVLSIIDGLHRFALFGYYSEWPGYGCIEQFPLGWRQVKYPGPSKGYHAFRGYLIEKFVE